MDEATENLTNEGRDALEKIGISNLLEINYRDAIAVIGKKNYGISIY